MKKKEVCFLLFFIIVIISIMVFSILLGKILLYNEKVYSALLYLGLCLVEILTLMVFNIISRRKLKNKIFKKSIHIISYTFIILTTCLCFAGIRALIYSNSNELVIIGSNYSLSDARKIKRDIDSIFENGSRNILIRNFYNDGDNTLLYIDGRDYDYTLKFYVEINNDKIDSIYYVINESKLYLYANGEKSGNFDYYYAMYIVFNMLGEDNSYGSIDYDIEDIIKDKLEDPSSVIFSYDSISYDSSEDTFSVVGYADTIDGLGVMENKKFLIEFTRSCDCDIKIKEYYNDNAFSYVLFNIVLL